MAKIVPLCSSSKGNSVYIGSKSGGVLIDVGCSFKRLNELLELNGIPLCAVKSILITHEHTDHIGGLFQITKRTDIPVYASDETLNYLARNNKVACEKSLFGLAELKNAPCDYGITSFKTPHDAVASVGYVLTDGNGCKISYCTDLGTVTDEVYENVIHSDIVFLESNYEPDLLKSNTNYPFPLKQRILSDIGHLSNHDSADFIGKLVTLGTARVMIGHLSEENNTPEIALSVIFKALSSMGLKRGTDYALDVAPVFSEGKAMVI